MKKLWHKFWMDWHDWRAFRPTGNYRIYHWGRYHYHREKLERL